MDYLAQWGPKGFLVSPDKIVTFDGFSTSIELNESSEKVTSGKTNTSSKGKKAQGINLSIKYIRAAGVDPRAQFEEWSSLVGQAYPLYIGGELFGPDNIMLKKVDLSGLQLHIDGTFLAATVAVSFEEYTIISVTKKAKKKTNQKKNTKEQSENTLNATAERQKAAAKRKTDTLLEYQQQAMVTADAKIKEQRKKLVGTSTGLVTGGTGGLMRADDRLTY